METYNNYSIKGGNTMFKKLASDALGLSDIGVVISRQDFDKTDADDFIFNEVDEQIYFLIKKLYWRNMVLIM